MLAGSKTPVSVVNEFFIARSINPLFEFVSSTGSAHCPSFRFKVSAGEYYAYGQGPSKQQAKQNAAQSLLEVLKDNMHDAPAYESNQLHNAIDLMSRPQDFRLNLNAVGQLGALCESEGNPEPVYKLVGEEGPPHAPIFTFSCSVSTIRELGAGRTKKEAKHQAAYAILLALQNLSGEVKTSLVRAGAAERPPERTTVEMDKKDEEATRLYFGKTKNLRAASSRLAYCVDRYRHYKTLMDKSPTLCRLFENPDEGLASSFKTLCDIGKDLDLEPTTYVCATTDKTESVTFVRLKVDPILVRAGKDGEAAAKYALEDLLEFLKA